METGDLVERVAKAMYESLPAWQTVGYGEHSWPNVFPDVRLRDDIIWRHLAAVALDEAAALGGSDGE